MSDTSRTSHAVDRIRASIDHPIIDADAHTVEYLPCVRDHLRNVAGADVVRRFDRHYWTMDQGWRLPKPLMRRFGIARPAWWTLQSRNSLDRATSMLPGLMYERLPEFGIDLGVIYPSYFIHFPAADDEDFRRGGCRATNRYMAEAFRGYEDRLIPVAAIPMHNPDEAVDELRHVTTELGMRAVVLNGVILRRTGANGPAWVDPLGLDSAHDYSPVWEFCQEHGIAATFHSVGMGWGSRASVSNFMHNHIGHFGAAGEATARSLLFAGVPRRYPRLRFSFLEGGVSAAAALFNQFTSNYTKRNRSDIAHYDPRHMNIDVIRSAMRTYGSRTMLDHIDKLEEALLPLSAPMEEVPDEFASSGCTSVDDVRDVFERSYFFGCESDDPLSALSSQTFADILGARLNTIYGSDVGHFDVPDMREVLVEAFELVDRGIYTADDFRRMMFEAPVRLWGDNNPDFFKGTGIEAAVAALHRAEDVAAGEQV